MASTETDMITRVRDSTIRRTIAFFAVTLLLSIGTGIFIAAATRGQLRFTPPATLAVVILLSPTITAIALITATNGLSGLRDLVSPLATWRVPIRWYVFAFFLPAVLNLASIGAHALLGGSLPTIPGGVPSDLEQLTTGGIATTTLSLSLYFFLGSLAEEIGWRGYALPRLQSRLTALSSSLTIGVIWALWHVPSFFLLPESTQAAIPFLWYVPSILAISVVFTWLYNNTGGSLLLVVILHASIQATNILLPNIPSDSGNTQLYGLYVIAVIAVAAVIIVIHGGQNLSRDHPRTTK